MPQPAPGSRLGYPAGEIHRETGGEETDLKPGYIGPAAPASAEVWTRRARGPRGAGRGGHGRSRPVSWSWWPAAQEGQELQALVAAFAAQATITQLPAPSSQLPGWLGRRKDLWRRLSKPKGFLFSLGSLGSVVLSRQAAQLPGFARVWDALCRGESALQDPGGKGLLRPSRAGRAFRIGWRLASHSVSPSFCIFSAFISTHYMPGILPDTGAT